MVPGLTHKGFMLAHTCKAKIDVAERNLRYCFLLIKADPMDWHFRQIKNLLWSRQSGFTCASVLSPLSGSKFRYQYFYTQPTLQFVLTSCGSLNVSCGTQDGREYMGNKRWFMAWGKRPCLHGRGPKQFIAHDSKVTWQICVLLGKLCMETRTPH